uniref:Uncharacterized protein n=1 Tax=Arundo donax TaxID=35708 RepID=A0A0A9CFK6_ARUDO
MLKINICSLEQVTATNSRHERQVVNDQF